MIDIESDEFKSALASYVQEHGQVVYGDGKNWTVNSNGQESQVAMVVNIQKLECRHAHKTLDKNLGIFVCDACGNQFKAVDFIKI